MAAAGTAANAAAEAAFADLESAVGAAIRGFASAAEAAAERYEERMIAATEVLDETVATAAETYEAQLEAADAALEGAIESAAGRLDAAAEKIAARLRAAAEAAAETYNSALDAADGRYEAAAEAIAAEYDATMAGADAAYVKAWNAAVDAYDATAAGAADAYDAALDAADAAWLADAGAAVDAYNATADAVAARYEAATTAALDRLGADYEAAADRYDGVVTPAYRAYYETVRTAWETFQEEEAAAYAETPFNGDDDDGYTVYMREVDRRIAAAWAELVDAEAEAWAKFEPVERAAAAQYQRDVGEAWGAFVGRIADADAEAAAAMAVADRTFADAIAAANLAWQVDEAEAAADYAQTMAGAEADFIERAVEAEAAWWRTEAGASETADGKLADAAADWLLDWSDAGAAYDRAIEAAEAAATAALDAALAEFDADVEEAQREHDRAVRAADAALLAATQGALDTWHGAEEGAAAAYTAAVRAAAASAWADMTAAAGDYDAAIADALADWREARAGARRAFYSIRLGTRLIPPFAEDAGGPTQSMARTDGADADDGAADEALQEELDRIDRDLAFTEAFLLRYGDPGVELLTQAFENDWVLRTDEDRSDWEWTGAASGWEIDLASRTIWIDAENTGWFYNEYLDPAAMADALWAALKAEDDEGRPIARAPMLSGNTLQAGDFPRTTGESGVTAFSSAMGMIRDGYWYVRKEVLLSAVCAATSAGLGRAAGGAGDITAFARGRAGEARMAAWADAAAGLDSHAFSHGSRYGKYIPKIEGYRHALEVDHVKAALREKGGEVVMLKSTGIPYDHLLETRQAMHGAKVRIIVLKKHLTDPNLNSGTRVLIEKELGTLSIWLDRAEEILGELAQ